MTATAIYDALAAWQKRAKWPMRCPHKCADPLMPVLTGEIVQLWCLDCGYVSEDISEAVVVRLLRELRASSDAAHEEDD